MSPNVAMEEKVGAAVAGAVARNGNGKLVLRNTPELQSLQQRNTGLWYVAATLDGASVSYGTIPAAYAGLAHLVHLFNDADLRGGAGVNDVASIDDVDTVAGEVRVLSGGFSDKGWPVLILLAATYPIYIPLISLALLAIFLTVPQIVRRVLTRVSDVAQKASEIQPRQHGVRLPVEGIPQEVAPLVLAFNGALERLENEFRKRQRFLIDAAHELRTPIAIMQTRIDGMADGPARTKLLDDVARLAGTAEQLLDFERNDQAADRH
jgi:signal transduction histidine kinase